MSLPLVLDADDFGLSPGVNAAVGALVEAGVVKEASLAVNGKAAEAAARMARAGAERFGVGLHLVLTEGRPLAGPIPGLTDRSGRFPGLRSAMRRLVARRPDVDALRREIRAQARRLHDWGLVPSHLNGHHHVHVFPLVRGLVLELLEEAPVGHVRLPRTAPGCASVSMAGLLLARWARAFEQEARVRGVPLPSLPFVGRELRGRRRHGARFQALLGRLPPVPVEWMVHPHADDTRNGSEWSTLSAPGLLECLRGAGREPARYAGVGRS